MRLLIIGSGHTQLSKAIHMAQGRGAQVTQCADISSALSLLRSGKGADLVMIDVAMSVKQLVDGLREERICVPVVGYGIGTNAAQAVAAIKAGAKEYIPLPPDEALIAAVLEAVTQEVSNLVFASGAMRDVLALADRIAPADASVLITGESGTGKEVVARYIHRRSQRAKEAFVSINCAAIPDTLLESELFGHEKGAFTGALHRRIGKFEEASGGTLLLDEISEMDGRLQAKLLRALQEKEIDRVGGSQPVKVNLRVLATSNRVLQEEMRAGRFREDLFFRLNVIHLHLPPLRDRREDIRPLAEHFAGKYAAVNGVPERALTPAALAALERYSWPGNIRELENTLHRAVLLGTGETIDEDAVRLPASSAQENKTHTEGGAAASPLVGRTVDSVEQELIVNTLNQCLGNRTHAATVLGISIRTLRNKLKQYETSEM